MRNDFAIFILTHGRPDDQKTYNALLKAGYTGKIYFVVDDLDETADRYIENYGDKVVIFDKKKVAEQTDTFGVNDSLKAVVFARNACFDIAKQLGVRWFVGCDDDIMGFYFRIPVDGKLVAQKVLDMDGLLTAMVGFMDDSGVECMSIAENGIYMGGINEHVKRGYIWSFAHFFLFNVKSDLRFRGFYYEDLIFSVEKAKVGTKMLSITSVAQVMPSLEMAEEKQKGGMRDAYDKSRLVCACNALTSSPDVWKIIVENGMYKLRKKNDSFMVRIMSDRWKK